MQIPDYLQPFQDEAETYLQKDLVKDIEFSGGTYQILVKDAQTGKDAWTFLQLENRGQIKDCFCDFEESEEFTPCVHLCAAYLRIFNGFPSPLHKRFERSLWNQLCHIYSDRLGVNPNLLKVVEKGHYICRSTGGKTVFDVKAKSAKSIKHLQEIVEQKHLHTEETSLKFSNLTPEEINLWRQGRPSSELQYELSFWSDLAKWMMTLQDSGDKYHIHFGYSDKDLPNEVKVSFSHLDMKFYISEANLSLIVPFLNSVNSSLKVYNAPEEEIEKISYDKKNGCLLVHPRLRKDKSQVRHIRQTREKEGIQMDRWVFIPRDGFYAKDRHQLLSSEKICGPLISQVLHEHFPLIKKLIDGIQLHDDPAEVSYALSFDSQWGLHIIGYLFTPGDLSSGNSRFFGDWAYLDGDGFYRLDGVRFPNLETVVPKAEVPDFIVNNRTWLNTQEGFTIHIASIEAQLTYRLSDDNKLSFTRQLALKEEAGESVDFGPWIYVTGQGFYSKVSSAGSLQVRPGIILKPDQIHLFIKENKEELNLIPGFFSDICPVIRAGLHIGLNKEEQITITPEYEILPQYKDRPIRFFEDYLYIDGDGFHELPMSAFLPERYRNALQIDAQQQDKFLNVELEALKPYILDIDQRLIKPEFMHLVASNIEKEGADGQGYSIKIKYQTDAGALPSTTLWGAIHEKKKFLFSDAGLIDLADERLNWLRFLRKTQVDRRSHVLHLSTIELIRLHAMEQLELQKGKSDDYERSKALMQELVEFKTPEDPDLTGLESHLRPYQYLGVKWLWFLYRHGLSGLLCDDMGLGKTHQTMALISAILNFARATEKKSKMHFLVICPTSVLYHWQEKLKEFLPGMRVSTFYGSERSIEDFHKDYDILLTSYGIWRIDNEMLSEIPFELAIFDEVQMAKNQSSRIYATLQNVNARMRLGLTGTPIENYIRELKSLFDIVLPSYMPGESEYREMFIKPIEKEGNRLQKHLLSRLIKPFVLRRKKEDVLLDLPEKIEEISHCDLHPEQEKLYNKVLVSGRESILKELEDEESSVPYVHIFALLSGLKQICNHPAAYLKCPQKYKEFQSGKWDLFVELLGEARESRQKVVVYSQYLFMLDIIEEHLKEAGIGFAGIRGATINRGEQLHRFNNNPECEVFVASLQAAGLGVDLTAGSVVIHYDRWWNAARENQATDRVHRIGQTRGVQVFKLVTKNTFEERIDEIISRKGQLMEDVIGVDDHQVVKGFTRKELITLLQETGKRT